MNTEYFSNILPNCISLITYIKGDTQYSKYFTQPSDVEQHPDNKILLHNLLTEELEPINLAQISNIIQVSDTGNSFLYKNFIKSKERFESFRSYARQIHLNLPPVLDKLTNHVTLTFENKIPLEVFSSFLKSKTLLPHSFFNLIEVITQFPNGSLPYFVLSCLFDATNLTVEMYKQYYKELVEVYVKKELEQLAIEWPLLTNTFPEINKNELALTAKYLEKVGKDSICRINKIKAHQIKENWHKLIKISYNCWPKMIQPNPFREFLTL